MKYGKHAWQTGARRGRTCLKCGIRRRVKPGTALTWQYRWPDRDKTWVEGVRCPQQRELAPPPDEP